LLNQIETVASAKKVTLKQLQSLCGLLAFCTKALPAGRAFSRQLYMTTSKASKPFHMRLSMLSARALFDVFLLRIATTAMLST
jgi:hypothetical protein